MMKKYSFFLVTALLLLAFLGTSETVLAQDTIPHTPEDSLAFAQTARAWSELPANKDSLSDWQITTVTAVLNEKVQALHYTFDNKNRDAAQESTLLGEQLTALKTDTTITKDSLAVVNNALKNAKKKEKSLNKLFSLSEKTKKHFETAIAQPAPVQRKNLAKNFAKCATLEKKLNDLTAPPPAPLPGETPDTKAPVAAAPPPVTEDIPPVAVVSADTSATVTDTTTQEGKRLSSLKKKLKPKEKQPEKPKPYQYNPQKDVMITPPVRPCAYALERRDEFTGAIYRETQKAELFRFTNNVKKKVLPEGQAHIICKAALATDGGNGKLLLEFTIQDASARRTFGGLAPRSLLSLRFLDGELITVFNEANIEGQFNGETGVAVFQAVYPISGALQRKLEKNELDQVRVAWSTGYEDYNVQHIGLFQQLTNCIK
jgi:hypothetical protein